MLSVSMVSRQSRHGSVIPCMAIRLASTIPSLDHIKAFSPVPHQLAREVW